MNIDFWTRKFEEPLNTDIADIDRAFLYSEPDSNIVGEFNDEERLMLACILLQGVYVPRNDEEIGMGLSVVARYNDNFAADTLLYRQPDGTIKCYRYNYKLFAAALPSYWGMRAVNKIYNRLGYELDESAKQYSDKESYKILQDNSLYGYALATLATEAKDSVAVASIDEDGASTWRNCRYIVASFVNYWSFYRKLYCQGIDFFEFMGAVGSKIPSFESLTFKKRTPYMQGLIDSVKRTARGRVYNTVNEDLLVIRATHGELFTPEKK